MAGRIMARGLAGGLVAGILIAALPSATIADQSDFMATSKPALQPIGHFQFCLAYQGECGPNAPFTNGFHMTPGLWRELVKVNVRVNRSVEPDTDQAIFGRPEVWTYPSGRGDCEDFVLLKRRLLAEQGWPLASVLITVVRQATGEDHAVLTLATDQGDFVLDNLTSKVLRWHQTGYRFLKRQSQLDSRLWVTIAPADDTVGAAPSGATP
jgi:predicted transglutaminase-like cysteine proteinase